MAPTTPSNSRACSYTPPVADGRGRSSQPPLRNVRTRIEASAAQRARGKDLIMAYSSRTMREDLPDTAVAEARLRKDRLSTTGQQIRGRGPLLGPDQGIHRDRARSGRLPALANLGYGIHPSRRVRLGEMLENPPALRDRYADALPRAPIGAGSRPR